MTLTSSLRRSKLPQPHFLSLKQTQFKSLLFDFRQIALDILFTQLQEGIRISQLKMYRTPLAYRRIILS